MLQDAKISDTSDEIVSNEAQLRDCEQIIESGLRHFLDIGSALLEIRDKALYKVAGYKNFDAYCLQRWGMHRQHAHRLIRAVQVCHQLETLIPGTVLPPNEACARELAEWRKRPDLLTTAWLEVTKAAQTGTPITARNVCEATKRAYSAWREEVNPSTPHAPGEEPSSPAAHDLFPILATCNRIARHFTKSVRQSVLEQITSPDERLKLHRVVTSAIERLKRFCAELEKISEAAQDDDMSGQSTVVHIDQHAAQKRMFAPGDVPESTAPT